MIFKIFANKGAGSATASVNYLIGKHGEREKATVLKGDIELTKQLAESLDFKNRYTVGVLSFQEKDLPQQTKSEIMESFEKTVFAGLESDQYSIAWVEHTDKDRLELNFIIANVELTTGKRLQPYYDRADRGLINAWKDVINHDYQLYDPNDPKHRLDLQPNKTIPREKNALRDAVHASIRQEVLNGQITDRSAVIAHMELLGLQIARTTKTAISIAHPDGGQNIRFKGEFYEQDFRIDESYTAENDRASRDYRTGERERIQRTRTELESRIENKRAYNQERYYRPTQAGFEHHQLPTKTNDYASDYGRYNGRNDNLHSSFNQQSDRFTVQDNRAGNQESGLATRNYSTQGQKVNEPIFETLQRANERARKTNHRTGELSRTAKQADRAIDERKQVATGTITDRTATAQAITGFNREIEQREREIGEREQAVNQLVREQNRQQQGVER